MPVSRTRARRLQKHAEFDQVYRRGRRHFSPHMTVFFLRREAGPGPRVGFTVGRVLGGAVERNRIRRRLREAARLELGKLPEPVDVVIHPKKSVLKAEFSQLREEMAEAFEKIRASVQGRPSSSAEAAAEGAR